MLSSFLFIAVLFITVLLFRKRMVFIRRNILLGKNNIHIDTTDGWKNLFWFALGQKKMFKNVPVALMHLVIYLGFFIINVEILEIIIDGVLGTHRFFLQFLSPSLYHWLIQCFEFLAVGTIAVCMIFLIRRNVFKVKRLASSDLNGWARNDANSILVFEILLMSLFLTMNATDTLLQSLQQEPYTAHPTGSWLFSGMWSQVFSSVSPHTLVAIERLCWWAHILGIFSFLIYVTFSKHLHIFLAFPSAYFSNTKQAVGTMRNMQNIQKEVALMFNPEAATTTTTEENPDLSFGAKDVQDLNWKQLMDAYSCTECGRCSAACPANLTGKKLSPRKIMMSVRDRLEEVGNNIDKNKTFVNDNKTLLHDYITEEELRACTTCHACVEACPVQLNPLSIIFELRRHLMMESSSAPQEWINIATNIENNQAPWQFSPDEKEKWLLN